MNKTIFEHIGDNKFVLKENAMKLVYKPKIPIQSITVVMRGQEYVAYLNNDVSATKSGRTSEEAIGNLIKSNMSANDISNRLG